MMLSRLGFGLSLAVASIAGGQTDTTTKLPPMVTVTRTQARSPFDLPFGITTVSPDSLRPGQAHVAADQTLLMIPGLTVANRSNPSQDVRVSVRGFGARSAFGVRSVRVVRDGMPLTMPDGQTPLDYLDLESIGRIEVIRGTASALYGNASGGVIDIHSTVPAPGLRPEARVWMGSNQLVRTTAVASGTTGAFAYHGNVGQTKSNNYRQYSNQRLVNAFGRATTTVRGTELAIVGLGLHMPMAENPGALTQTQNDTNPRMADPLSITRKARKEVDQVQVGLSANRRVGPGTISVTGYGGTRSLFNPLTFAVVGVERKIAGATVRADFDVAAVRGLRLTAGGDFQRQDDDRKNWANCNGVTTATASCTVLGQEKGVLQIDQQETVNGGGPYARLELERGIVRAGAGVRSDAIRFKFVDRLTSNGDDSGERTLRALSPMAGVALRLSRVSSVYANYTTAFETPTTTEIGNQEDGSAGLNRSIQPQYSSTVEVGTKGILGSASYEMSVFHTSVRDELIGFRASSGRDYFRNAGRTGRDGVELAGEWTPGWVEVVGAYAYSRFRFVDFAPGGVQMKGKMIPGIPEHQFQLSMARRFSRGGFALVEGVSKSRIWANDANTASAAPYEVFNVRMGRDFHLNALTISPVVGVNNALDRRYVGSLAINATAAAPAQPKFYEPAPGRTWLAGARVGFTR